MTESERDETYLGVSTAELIALGKMCVGYGRIEGLAHNVATAAGIDPTNRNLSGLVKDVRKKVDADGLPPWASASATEVIEWLDRIPNAAQSRDKLIHAVTMAQARDGEWLQVSQNIRSGDLDDDRLGSTMKVVQAFKAIEDDGTTLHARMLYAYREGVYVPIYRGRHTPAGFIVARADDSYPARPTNEELRAVAKAQLRAAFPEPTPPAD